MSLLAKFVPDKQWGRHPDHLPPIETEEGEEEFEVEKIMDWKIEDSVLLHRVLWLNYPPHKDTWEPEEHIQNANKALRKFKADFPGALGVEHKWQRTRLKAANNQKSSSIAHLLCTTLLNLPPSLLILPAPQLLWSLTMWWTTSCSHCARPVSVIACNVSRPKMASLFESWVMKLSSPTLTFDLACAATSRLLFMGDPCTSPAVH